MATRNPKKTIVSTKPFVHYSHCRSLGTGSSTWSKRNDSENVGSILGGDSSYFSLYNNERPRRPTIFSKTRAPGCLHHPTCSSCYCQKPPVKPTLHCSKPKPSYHQESTKTFRHSYIPEKPEKKKTADKITSKPHVFTNQRQNYENHSADYFVKFRNELDEVKKDLEILHRDNLDGGKMIGNKKGLEDLQKFRKQHYFQCHTSGVDESTSTTDHICVHKFELGDDLKVKAKNSDEYGQSRCAICNKPLSSPKPTQLSSSGYSLEPEMGSENNWRCDDAATNTSKSLDDVHLLEKLKNRRKARHVYSSSSCDCDTEDTNSKIHNVRKMRGGKVVEIQVSKDALKDDDKLEKIRRRNGRNVPSNTMALRFQKGVCR